jgi:hypothetical protein
VPPNYKETRDTNDPANTKVTFEADAIAGKQGGPDSIRLIVRPKGPDVACLGKFDDITERELSSVTLRYALRATLRCMNPCLTDDDLDFLTSCDDWELMAKRIKRLRSTGAPPGAEQPEDPTPEDPEDDPINAFLNAPVGCSDAQVSKGKTEGKLSGRIKDEKSGRCEQTNPFYKPSMPPPMWKVDQPQINDTYTPTDAQLEFQRFKTWTDASLLYNQRVGTEGALGALAELRWHFAGSMSFRAHGGFVGDRVLAGVRLQKSPSKHELSLVGSVLPLQQGAQKSEFGLGDAGIGIPNGTGTTAITIAPLTYFREDVNRYTGFQTSIIALTEQNIGKRLTLIGGGRFGVVYGSSPSERLETEAQPQQQGMGTLIGATTGLRVAFGDVADTNHKVLPYVGLSGLYDRHQVRVRTAQALEQTIGFEAWTALLAAGMRF